MPWTAKSFKKHNRKATKKMADVANAVLRETGDEGKAIRIANAQGKRKRKRRRKGNAMRGAMMMKGK
jgi:uncharacterized protein YdaT